MRIGFLQVVFTSPCCKVIPYYVTNKQRIVLCRQAKEKLYPRKHKYLHCSCAPSTTRTKEDVLKHYEAVIGIEVHVQLATKSKTFCACPTSFGAKPNTNVCPICLGFPGTLPLLNQEVVQLATRAAVALNCEIALKTKMDRKNYFYPDTPKNYQISQNDRPLGKKGYITLPSGRNIRIHRVHMEEDSGKMLHQGASSLTGSTHTFIDYNRAGIPLIEIVSEPDITSPSEAAEYGEELRRIMRYIGVSDCNMEEGTMRLDVNISLRRRGEKQLGTKVELKNINSFHFVSRAVDFEIIRQGTLLLQGQKPIQETRLWNEKSQSTMTMRVKEVASDYRYFPEPDIPPIQLEQHQVDAIRRSMEELPAEKRKRYVEELGLSLYDANNIANELSIAKLFEATVRRGVAPKLVVNWIMSDIMKYLNQRRIDISETKLNSENLAELISLIENKTISGRIAKDILPILMEKGSSVKSIVEERGLQQLTDKDKLEQLIKDTIVSYPKEVEMYKSGKTKLLGFFVGQVMKSTGGKADPVLTNQLVKELLSNGL
ncbi:hypothetical protein GAYE_SCF61G6503 [Galdieria yellowstonensis]|uniref:Glutamyl-tRNA(Gln) amidotransferase subunit B, mitochondrial n=1 Tax=Galdieria yellowstonensis TaxID=3028027 RepID=A0AAV9IMH9_9RHOD|nr:hypothetical protein GAYE_SCF61G6503 [Galdieria yellowstonensis]